MPFPRKSPLTTAHPSSGILDGTHLLSSSPSPLAGSATSVIPVPVEDRSKWNRVRGGGRRVKPPKDSKVYKASLSIVALRAQGQTYGEIAELLGYTKNTVITYLKRAARMGWLNIENFDDPDDQLEHILKTKVVKNLNSILNETVGADSDPSAPSNRAFSASLEIAKGTGLLKQHQVVKNDSHTSLGVALRVQVEMPPPGKTTLTIPAGSIGGTPAYDAEIIHTQE